MLLLGALLGSLPLLSWRLGGSWPWVGVGLVCFTVADAAYSLTAADVVAHDGPYDFLWSAGALAFAVGATRLPSPAHPSREITGWPAIVLPLGAQLFAVATQVYGYFRPLPAAERLLTIAVLIIGIAQIIVSRPRPDPERDATEPRPCDGDQGEMPGNAGGAVPFRATPRACESQQIWLCRAHPPGHRRRRLRSSAGPADATVFRALRTHADTGRSTMAASGWRNELSRRCQASSSDSAKACSTRPAHRAPKRMSRPVSGPAARPPARSWAPTRS